MRDLIAKIQAAQRDAAERAVIAHLECGMGAQPAQAVPQLTDDEIDAVWDAIPQTQFWWRRYARAIEQAVRAKQATPLPAEQIQKLRHLIDWTDSESYLTFARAVEAAHGIGKGGA